MSVEADRAALEQTLSDWAEASNQGGDTGADGFAAFVTEDGVMLPPNQKRADGQAAIRGWALGLTSAQSFNISWKTGRAYVTAGSKLAYAVGVFELSLKDGAGNLVTDRGKFLDAFERQAEGTWLCTVGSWNSDQPAG